MADNSKHSHQNTRLNFTAWVEQYCHIIEDELRYEAWRFVESHAPDGAITGNLELDDQWHYFKTRGKDAQKSGYRGTLRTSNKGVPQLTLTIHRFRDGPITFKDDVVTRLWEQYKANNPTTPKRSNNPTVKEAIEQYHSLPSTGQSEYLKRKQVKTVPGIRFGDGFITVSMQTTNGDIASVQRIYDDGSKLFATNTKKNGLAFLIGLPLALAEKIVLCEGMATGLSLHQADCADSVVVTFDSGNLRHVAAWVSEQNKPFIIAADNDHVRKKTDSLLNPGLNAAYEIAAKYGRQVTYPTNITKTDFNDLQVELGIEAVKSQFNDNLTDANEVKSYLESIGQFAPKKTFDTLLDVPKSRFDQANVSNDIIENKEEKGFCHFWHAPLPLIEKDTSLCEVTPEMIPQNVRGWLTDIADRMQIYPTFPSVALISFVSSIIARRVAIHPKRFDKEWRVIPNVWGAIVGQPGTQKTPSLAPIFEPIRKRENKLRTEYQAKLKEYQTKVKGLKKSDEKPDGPNRRTLFTNDATVEALHELHVNNPQGVLVYRDELSGFVENMSKQGREGERQFFLEGWSGDGTYSLSRVGRGDVYVDQLCLTVFGGIQPRVLSKYTQNAASGKFDDGFIQRFQLLVKSVPKEDYQLMDVESNYEAKNQFDDVIERLLNLPDHGEPICTQFNDDAQPVFNAWLETLERRLRGGKLPVILASHLSKYRSLLASLALIFEVINNSAFCFENIIRNELLPLISLDSLNLAISWCAFLEKHAVALLLDSPPTANDAALLADKILQKFKTGQGKFTDGMTLRDLQRSFRARTDTKNLDAAIQLLDEFCWIKVINEKTGGRPKVFVRVNPFLFDNDVTKVSKWVKKDADSSIIADNLNTCDKYIPKIDGVTKGVKNVTKGLDKIPKKNNQYIDNISNLYTNTLNVPEGDLNVPKGDLEWDNPSIEIYDDNSEPPKWFNDLHAHNDGVDISFEYAPLVDNNSYALSPNAQKLLIYLQQNGGRAFYRDGLVGLDFNETKGVIQDLMTQGLANDRRYQFEVELTQPN